MAHSINALLFGLGAPDLLDRRLPEFGRCPHAAACSGRLAVTMPADPVALLRSRGYLRLLALAAILGVPVSAAAYGFLALVSYLQKEIFTHLPHGLGFHTEPVWWPLPVLAVGGLLAALAIRYLPGRGGPSPAGGFKLHGPPAPRQLPGVILAALATLVFGAVLGPEMPLILVGGGLAVLAVRLARRDVPDQAAAVLAAVGQLRRHQHPAGQPPARRLPADGGVRAGRPDARAGAAARAAGGGDRHAHLHRPGHLDRAGHLLPGDSRAAALRPPTLAEFGWAVAIGVAAALVGPGIRWLGAAAALRRPVDAAGRPAGRAGRRPGWRSATPRAPARPPARCCSPASPRLRPLIQHSASYTVGALLLLMVCKGLAYGVSLGSFRGGPVFPAMFIGAAGGIALSHLPGLPLVRRRGHGHRRDVRSHAHPAADLRPAAPACCWPRTASPSCRW